MFEPLALVVALHTPTAGAQDRQTVEQAVTVVSERLGDEVDPVVLYRAALDGLAAGLDASLGVRGNAVLSTAEQARWEQWSRGDRDGIGVEFTISAGRGLLITDVFTGGPGDTAGLRPGDLVVAMDDQPFTGQAPSVIHALVERASGRHVVLDILQAEDQLRRLEVTRGPYRLDGVRRVEGTELPCLRVPFFGEGVAAALAEALAELDPEVPLVLDLRDNQGGLQSEAAAAAEHFLDPGEIIVQQAVPGAEAQATVARVPPLWSAPLVVLTNRGTRGPAETFAAALQDHRRATVVGTPTAGDAAVRTHHPLGEGLVLQLVEPVLLGPAGRSWSGAGVQPDVLVEPVGGPLLVSPGRLPPDLQQEAAIRLMRGP